jgi:hypothetical protein
MTTAHPWTCARPSFVLRCWATLTLALLATIASGVEPRRTDKDIKEPGTPPLVTPTLKPPEVKEVRIWNITNEPFKYRLAKSDGVPWTAEITVEPGKYQTILIPKPGEPSELEGITLIPESVYRGRYFGIRYPKYGGFLEANMPIEEGEKGIPIWFHVKDANGYSDMISAANVEDARKRQADLLQEKPLTPEEIEKRKIKLRANWEFYDK